MDFLRTPDERFDGLPGWPYAPRYAEVGGLRIHYVDEGPLVAAGHRAVAPDLVGFGRSDKPARREDYTYARHVEWMGALLEGLALRDATLVCQDWGGLIGLRLAAERPQLFARIVA